MFYLYRCRCGAARWFKLNLFKLNLFLFGGLHGRVK